MSQIAMADTVTLSGSCQSQIINQSASYLLFNLSNSGNGTATNLMLIPEIEGATTPNSIINIPLIGPSSSYTTRFYLDNFTMPGGYVEYITVKYSQGSTDFLTIFPCIAQLSNNTQSLLDILNISRTGSRINVTVYNLANYPIYANVTVRAPPLFNVSPKSGQYVSISSKSKSDIFFNLSTPSYTSARFPIVAAVSYVNDSVHHASMNVYTINFAASTHSSGILTTIIIIAVILILLILIILSILMRRKKKVPEAKQ